MTIALTARLRDACVRVEQSNDKLLQDEVAWLLSNFRYRNFESTVLVELEELSRIFKDCCRTAPEDFYKAKLACSRYRNDDDLRGEACDLICRLTT